MVAKIVFFFTTILFLFIFMFAAHDIMVGEKEVWQEWLVTSFTVLWLVFWGLWFRKKTN